MKTGSCLKRCLISCRTTDPSCTTQVRLPLLTRVERFEIVSLNREQRKRDLMKITVENQAILRRLQDKPPTYSVNKWETDYKKVEQLKQNLWEYPYDCMAADT